MSTSPPLISTDLSRYSARMMLARPGLETRLPLLAATPATAAGLRQRLDELQAPDPRHAGESAEDRLKRALRLLRSEVMCALIERDLDGRADLGEVTGTMTLLAELAVQAALAVIGAELESIYGAPTGEQSGENQTLVVVGMGKLGGRELNVSSDIDLIFLYDEDGETKGGSRSLSNHEYFTRLGRRLINVLADITADGYVFRVDMRLRPNGDSGPLVCSLAMLEEYLMVQGREWERYAWIKGRVVSADDTPQARCAIGQLEAIIRPFVFRRYLDYGVIAAIRALHAQIRAEAGKKASRGFGNGAAPNIKLGRGGIREIEFIAQVFQLIRGGQDGALRVKPTLQVLDRVAERGLLPVAARDQLRDAYVFLRNLEHRLQYLDDAQTHSLPENEEDQQRVATMMGFADYPALLAVLAGHQEAVARQFDDTFADRQEDSQGAAPDLWSAALEDEAQHEGLRAQLELLGVAGPASVLTRLCAAWRSPRFRALGENTRQRFDALMRRAIDLGCRCADPGETIGRLIAFFEAISRRASYLSLLSEYPQALARLTETLAASRWAAEYLTRHPQLLDELLDVRTWDDAFDSQAHWAAFRAELEQRLREADSNVELQMDLLRQAHHAETFRVLLQDLQQHLTVEQIGDHLSDLADTLLDITARTVWAQLASRHRETPRFAIIAYGRLGGKELGYASDLDVVFIYDDDDERAPQVYATFARRLINWLTSHTAAGILFDIDTRLRPNGEAGLLATSLDAFRRYQLREGDNAAWVWEHQALTRARFCAGDPGIGAGFEIIRKQVLQQTREAEELAREIMTMRQKVSDGHPNRTDAFDLKHDRGGMVDIEFTVQYLVLLHSREYPVLLANAGNIALLRIAAAEGLIDGALAEQVGAAYRSYRSKQHALRLNGEPHPRVGHDSVAREIAATQALWSAVFTPGRGDT